MNTIVVQCSRYLGTLIGQCSIYMTIEVVLTWTEKLYSDAIYITITAVQRSTCMNTIYAQFSYLSGHNSCAMFQVFGHNSCTVFLFTHGQKVTQYPFIVYSVP